MDIALGPQQGRLPPGAPVQAQDLPPRGSATCVDWACSACILDGNSCSLFLNTFFLGLTFP